MFWAEGSACAKALRTRQLQGAREFFPRTVSVCRGWRSGLGRSMYSDPGAAVTLTTNLVA